MVNVETSVRRDLDERGELLWPLPWGPEYPTERDGKDGDDDDDGDDDKELTAKKTSEGDDGILFTMVFLWLLDTRQRLFRSYLHKNYGKTLWR